MVSSDSSSHGSLPSHDGTQDQALSPGLVVEDHWHRQTGWDMSSLPHTGKTKALAGSPCLRYHTSSEPSAQSWSPSHFHLPAMQRPLAHENSLSEQGRGAVDREHGVFP